ncbi:12960_t:CDS:2 [Rhizophagus irregularis]|nr:12960_t:CDS:2 [Rhizophagus irregularis]
MDATNFNNDKPEKFEYMEDVSRVMSVASSTQSPQTKNYLAKKSGGIQKRAFVPTVPNPFKFYTETRANNSCNKENSKSPFIPLALSVQQFLENPTRFDAKSGKVRSNTLTVPKSPYLRTKYRSKPTTILPTEEREIREMRGYRFKANPLDRKEFRSPKSTKAKAD